MIVPTTQKNIQYLITELIRTWNKKTIFVEYFFNIDVPFRTPRVRHSPSPHHHHHQSLQISLLPTVFKCLCLLFGFQTRGVFFFFFCISAFGLACEWVPEPAGTSKSNHGTNAESFEGAVSRNKANHFDLSLGWPSLAVIGGAFFLPAPRATGHSAVS